MNMNQELVSVIIPTYKRPLKLDRAINSVLNQTYRNIEIIVVDDNNEGTPERFETEELMKRYYNYPVRYVKHKFNKNGSAARNTGFNNSSGTYLMFLDDDDEFLPGKIEAQVNTLESLDSTWGACYTRYLRKKDGVVVATCGETKEGNLFFDVLCRNLFIHAGSNLMIRRNVFKELNGFDESFQRNQDIEFTVRLLQKYKLAFTNTMGLIVNVHTEKRKINVVDVTNHYKENFQNHINMLNNVEKAKFNTLINLQIFRYFILSKKDFSKALNMIKKRKVNILDIFRYFSHLLVRKIRKKSYGFKI